MLAVAAIARVEVPAALWRKRRLGELEESDATVLTRDFEADFLGTDEEEPRFAVVALASPVLDRAASLLPSHSLRAYDAVQLASALEARDADPDCSSFACFDDDLREAAAASGYELLPERLPAADEASSS